MSAPWVQTALVGVVLAGAAFYLARRAWLRFRVAQKEQPGHCGPGCGCGH